MITFVATETTIQIQKLKAKMGAMSDKAGTTTHEILAISIGSMNY